MTDRTGHPWITSLSGRIGFGLQAVAAHSEGDRGAALIRAGKLAEHHGYDAFFLGDHPAWAPECWLHLAVIAAQTERIRLGQLVAAEPYRTPLLTARLQTDLDRISNGRSILGLGIGWNAADYGLGENEFSRMGLPYPPVRERQAALEEAIAIIRGVWGVDPFTFIGEHHSANDARIDPPIQSGGIPLVIAGAGTRTLGQLARLGDICNFGAGPAGNVSTPADAQVKLEILRVQCEAVNRSYDDILRSHFTHWAIVAPDERAVAAKVNRYFPEGLDDFWGNYLVAGTPEAVAEHYQGFVDSGVTFFVIQTLDPDDEESIAAMMQDIAPRLRPHAIL